MSVMLFLLLTSAVYITVEAGDNYLGCFKESIKDKAVPHLMRKLDSSNTNPRCARSCDEMGYKYSATTEYTLCFCGNGDDYGRYGKAPASKCNAQCPGDMGDVTMCGGTGYISVYRATGQASLPLPPKPKLNYLGCYNTQVLDRALPMMLAPYNTGNDNVWCAYQCMVQKQKYAATAQGYVCFCSNGDPPYDRFGKADESKCNEPCYGDHETICGGTYVVSVYEAKLTKAEQWKVYKGLFIAMNNVREIKGISLDKCKVACKAHSGCVSFDYGLKTNRCYLSTMSYGEAQKKHLLRKHADFNIYVLG